MSGHRRRGGRSGEPWADLDADGFADAVERMSEEAMATATRRPRQRAPQRGRMFHVRAVVKMLVAGKQAFQVVAFARTEFYPQVSKALLRAVASFEPPGDAAK